MLLRNLKFRYYLIFGVLIIITALYFYFPPNQIISEYLTNTLKKRGINISSDKANINILDFALRHHNLELVFQQMSIKINCDFSKIKIQELLSSDNRAISVEFENAAISQKFGNINISNGKLIYNLKNQKIKILCYDVKVSEQSGWQEISIIFLVGVKIPEFRQKDLLIDLEINNIDNSFTITKLNSTGELNLRGAAQKTKEKLKLQTEIKITNNYYSKNYEYFKNLSARHQSLDFQKTLYLNIDEPNLKNIKNIKLTNYPPREI
ncbi:MAG TPA: hypothetical protein PLM75_06100 [bacterium]|nr:hypothetical protein [bacterium]